MLSPNALILTVTEKTGRARIRNAERYFKKSILNEKNRSNFKRDSTQKLTVIDCEKALNKYKSMMRPSSR